MAHNYIKESTLLYDEKKNELFFPLISEYFP